MCELETGRLCVAQCHGHGCEVHAYSSSSLSSQPYAQIFHSHSKTRQRATHTHVSCGAHLRTQALSSAQRQLLVRILIVFLACGAGVQSVMAMAVTNDRTFIYERRRAVGDFVWHVSQIYKRRRREQRVSIAEQAA